jgi:phenylacetate-CoA ligase
MNTQDLYLASPEWVQKLGVMAYGWWWQRRRFGQAFHRAVAELRARDGWSRDRFESHQREQLAKLLLAANQAPYYQELFARAGGLGDGCPYRFLEQLPFLGKETLRRRGRDLLTEKQLPRGVAVFKSSGTTGTPTEIFFTADFHQLVQAYFEVRNRNWANVNYRSRRAMFGVRKVCRFDQRRPPFWRTSPAENLAYFSIYHLSRELMPAYVEYLHDFGPEVVMGYPNSLVTLAKFALSTGAKLPKAKAIITTSETVTDEIRSALEAAWSCKVFDNYCAVEACMLATQCAEGGYHVSPDFGVFEIVDDAGKPCPKGVIGRAIYTGLNNHLQPLIRYDIGDAVAWSEAESCACGRPLPLIRSIEGRIEDMCYTSDGRAVLRFDTVFKGIETIREAQVEQRAIGDFVIRVVPTPEFSSKDRELLLHNMRSHVGEATTAVELVERIPRTSAGKFRPVISSVRASA